MLAIIMLLFLRLSSRKTRSFAFAYSPSISHIARERISWNNDILRSMCCFKSSTASFSSSSLPSHVGENQLIGNNIENDAELIKPIEGEGKEDEKTRHESSYGSRNSYISRSDFDKEGEEELEASRHYFPIFYNDVYEVHLPPGHRFPMGKYRKVREKVQAEIASLKHTLGGRVDCGFHISPLATREELITTHCPNYVDRYMKGHLTKSEMRNVGFPWNEENVKRAYSSVGGTVAAAQEVCRVLVQRRKQKKADDSPLVWAAHVAGGTHHAFHDYGEGFCVFSDIAVAANVMLRRFPDVVKRILIIDLDVHQGNGNAQLFRGRNDVLTFSMHCESNYFSPKEQSDLDIELPTNCTDGTYLSTLRHWLKRLLMHEKEKEDFTPYDLVFFQAGVDVIAEDRLGRMSLSSNGVQRRNELVYNFVKESGAGGLVITMGGGYPKSDDNWRPIIEAHANVYLNAYDFLSKV